MQGMGIPTSGQNPCFDSNRPSEEVNLPWFPQRTCSSAVWFRATKILKIVLPVFYFNHPILIARIFSQEFFPELYEAQDYS